MLNNYCKRLLAIFVMAGLSACAQYDNKRGVEVVWQSTAVADLQVGKSTRSDVLKLLGPPSQVIALADETVFYYLYEYSTGKGVILIVYNQVDIDTRYDRAIFFFDENDLLTEFSTRAQN